MEANEKIFEFDGAKAHYWVFGEPNQKSKYVVMVHGFRGTHHGLMDITREITKLSPNTVLYVPDLPGYGKSSPFKTYTHDADGYVAFFIAFIKYLSLKKSPVLFGHSFGTIVAAKLAAKHPKQIEKLILAAPIVCPQKSHFNTRAGGLLFTVGKMLPENSGAKLLGSPIFTDIAHMAMTKTKNRELWHEIRGKHRDHFSEFYNRKVLLETYNSSINNSVMEVAKDIVTPTLLITGGKDILVPKKEVDKLKKTLPKATEIHIRDTGHIMHHEVPDQISKAILDFI